MSSAEGHALFFPSPMRFFFPLLILCTNKERECMGEGSEEEWRKEMNARVY